MQKKENRGVRKTKNQIKDSLLQLLEEKHIDKISVKELCEVADINRGTFYFHYHDIYELLTELENEFLKDFQDVISHQYETPLAAITSILDYMDENATFMLRVIDNKTGDHFVTTIQKTFEHHISALWKNELNSNLYSEHHLAEHFIFGGIIYNFYFRHKHKLEINIENRNYFIQHLLYHGILN